MLSVEFPDVLILRVENGNDTFISIEGTYRMCILHPPLLSSRLSCLPPLLTSLSPLSHPTMAVPTPLHLPLDLLVRLPCPIRSIPRSSAQDFFEDLLPLKNSLSLPREIWRLVDWLMSDLESPLEGGQGRGDRLFLDGGPEEGDEEIRGWVLEVSP